MRNIQGFSWVINVFLSLALLVQLLILGQLCQIESENKIWHKFIDMTTENFNVELRKVIT